VHIQELQLGVLLLTILSLLPCFSDQKAFDILVGSKGFSRRCMRLRTAEFLDFVHRPVFYFTLNIESVSFNFLQFSSRFYFCRCTAYGTSLGCAVEYQNCIVDE
jgi:hypothetical protein